MLKTRLSVPDILICAALLSATFAVYARVWHFDFVNLDDAAYTSAFQVRQGITTEGLKWAFTSGDAANWFPVTWISHMLDSQFFGLNSGWDHLVNVGIHGLAALLLFGFLQSATGARWRSALVALLFAVHPLHVESVAWVAERKDVLSAFFWFLTLWAYVRYTRRPGAARYGLLLLALCLGLMSKPMLVTLPFVLVLLDIWPLRRLASDGKPHWAIFWEKAPLFALSMAVSIVTFLAQQRGGAVKPLVAIPFGSRLENGLVSYSTYIVQMFWPLRLAVFYPYPKHLPIWEASLAGLALAGISAAVVLVRRSRPYLAVGWFWYVGMLIPVIGLVQVGAQAHADRYMYLPMVGLSIMVAWGLAGLARRPGLVPYAATVSALACLACAGLAWLQVQHWRNSGTLFRHALGVTKDNAVAHTNLALYLMDVPGRSQEAVGHLETALRIDPDSAPAHTELGRAFANMPGRLMDSFPQFQAALRLAPDWPIVHNELGNALLKAGRLPDAITQFVIASRLDPDFAPARYNLAVALSQVPNRRAEAVAEYREALRIQPNLAEADLDLGNVLSGMRGRLAEAIESYRAALRIRPDYAEAHYNLGRALSTMPGGVPDAIAEYQAALRIRPDYYEAHNNLGNLLSQMPGRVPDAIAEYQAALRIKPDYAEGHYDLGVVLSRIPGRFPDALAELQEALRLQPNPALQRVLDRIQSSR